MTGWWPFKKVPILGASSSRKKTPPKNHRTRPYMNVNLARALYEQNRSVSVCDVHLPGGWLLNARRVSVPLVSRRGREWRDEIHRRQAILP
jgi:hypothetical protein